MNLTKNTCIQVLHYIVYVGLLLSGGNVTSHWIDQILLVLKSFPGSMFLMFDSLLMIQNMRKKYHQVYALILKHVLQVHMQNPPDAESFFKTLLLYRRLRYLSEDPAQKQIVCFIAAKVKCPPDFSLWISSLKIKMFDDKCDEVANILLTQHLDKSILKIIHKVLFKEKYPESITNLPRSRKLYLKRKPKKKEVSGSVKGAAIEKEIVKKEACIKVESETDAKQNCNAQLKDPVPILRGLKEESTDNVCKNQSIPYVGQRCCQNPYQNFRTGLQRTQSQPWVMNVHCPQPYQPVIINREGSNQLDCFICSPNQFNSCICDGEQNFIDRRNNCCEGHHPSNMLINPCSTFQSVVSANSFNADFSLLPQNIVTPSHFESQPAGSLNISQPTMYSNIPSNAFCRSHSSNPCNVNRDQFLSDKIYNATQLDYSYNPTKLPTNSLASSLTENTYTHINPFSGNSSQNMNYCTESPPLDLIIHKFDFSSVGASHISDCLKASSTAQIITSPKNSQVCLENNLCVIQSPITVNAKSNTNSLKQDSIFKVQPKINQNVVRFDDTLNIDINRNDTSQSEKPEIWVENNFSINQSVISLDATLNIDSNRNDYSKSEKPEICAENNFSINQSLLKHDAFLNLASNATGNSEFQNENPKTDIENKLCISQSPVKLDIGLNTHSSILSTKYNTLTKCDKPLQNSENMHSSPESLDIDKDSSFNLSITENQHKLELSKTIYTSSDSSYPSCDEMTIKRSKSVCAESQKCKTILKNSSLKTDFSSSLVKEIENNPVAKNFLTSLPKLKPTLSSNENSTSLANVITSTKSSNCSTHTRRSRKRFKSKKYVSDSDSSCDENLKNTTANNPRKNINIATKPDLLNSNSQNPKTTSSDSFINLDIHEIFNGSAIETATNFQSFSQSLSANKLQIMNTMKSPHHSTDSKNRTDYFNVSGEKVLSVLKSASEFSFRETSGMLLNNSVRQKKETVDLGKSRCTVNENDILYSDSQKIINDYDCENYSIDTTPKLSESLYSDFDGNQPVSIGSIKNFIPQNKTRSEQKLQSTEKRKNSKGSSKKHQTKRNNSQHKNSFNCVDKINEYCNLSAGKKKRPNALENVKNELPKKSDPVSSDSEFHTLSSTDYQSLDSSRDLFSVVSSENLDNTPLMANQEISTLPLESSSSDEDLPLLEIKRRLLLNREYFL